MFQSGHYDDDAARSHAMHSQMWWIIYSGGVDRRLIYAVDAPFSSQVCLMVIMEKLTPIQYQPRFWANKESSCSATSDANWQSY